MHDAEIARLLTLAADALDASVPDSLAVEAIFRDPKGAHLWSALAQQAGLPAAGAFPLLGRGTRGAAYQADENRVLKVTTDASEAIASAIIRDNPDPKGNVSRIDSVWYLKGAETARYAVVQELLSPLEDDDRWIFFSDLWPDWTESQGYVPILPTVIPAFFSDMEKLEAVSSDEREWRVFRAWFVELAAYLDEAGIQYHDFWHRNLLMRGDQHVAIDFGYSRSKERPAIETIANLQIKQRCAPRAWSF